MRSLLVLPLLLVACAPVPTAEPTPTAQPAQPAQCHYQGAGDADPSCTPGVWNPAVTDANLDQTVCMVGWTATIRPSVAYTNALKVRQLAEYGQSGRLSDYEEDHWRPLEGGGAPQDERNLFPMPIALARQKDLKENLLHRRICERRHSLDEEHRLWEQGWETYQ